MIKITINHASNGQVNFLEIKGHAKSASYGQDLVCAAVSSVITGGFNNLNGHKNYELKLDEGYALFKSVVPLDAHDETVIETIICGLNTIKESNPEFIQIKTDK